MQTSKLTNESTDSRAEHGRGGTSGETEMTCGCRQLHVDVVWLQ